MYLILYVINVLLNYNIMKKIKLLSYLVILLSGFLFLQCTSDEPIYVAGDAGADGINGIPIGRILTRPLIFLNIS